MARLSSEQLDIIKDKFGVNTLWSYSKVSTYLQCSWAYYLKYVKKIRVKGDNCYTWWGTVAHNLIQGLYDGEHSYSEMLEKFEDKVLEFNMTDDPKLKFPNDDEYQHYIDNLRHYFTHVKKLPYKLVNEKPVIARFDGDMPYIFQGYIDSTYVDDDGDTIIHDYKTSSLSGFTGAKLIEKSKQLMIYAMGMHVFFKIPLDKIKIRYDMMKYCIVEYPQKNGKIKETKSERRLWVAKIANQLRKDLEDIPKQIESLEKEIAKLTKKMNMKKTTPEEAEGYSVAIGEIEHKINTLKQHQYDVFQINEMIDTAIENNNLSNMPQFIQDKYTVKDCYIDVELTPEVLDNFITSLVETLDEITGKEKTESVEESFSRGHIEERESYYCTNLCELRDHCNYYKEYREHNTMFLDKKEEMSDEQLLAMLGLD